MKSIETKPNVKPPKPPEFPKLMISDIGTIVLFDSNANGMTVKSGAGSTFVGEYFKGWDMSRFRAYYGTVSISNK